MFFESIFVKYPELETLPEDEDDEVLKASIVAFLSDEAFVD